MLFVSIQKCTCRKHGDKCKHSIYLNKLYFFERVVLLILIKSKWLVYEAALVCLSPGPLYFSYFLHLLETRMFFIQCFLSFFRILWIDVMKQAACVQLIELSAADCSLLVIALSAFFYLVTTFVFFFITYVHPTCSGGHVSRAERLRLFYTFGNYTMLFWRQKPCTFGFSTSFMAFGDFSSVST